MAKIKNYILRFTHSDMFRFIIVGIINTTLSMIFMLFLYNVSSLGYWGASAITYTLASIFSFFANRAFTFKNSDSIRYTFIKFSINIAICYFIAYLAAKPFVFFVIEQTSLNIGKNIAEQIAMLFAIVIFTGLNYIGQKFFVFKKHQ